MQSGIKQKLVNNPKQKCVLNLVEHILIKIRYIFFTDLKFVGGKV